LEFQAPQTNSSKIYMMKTKVKEKKIFEKQILKKQIFEKQIYPFRENLPLCK